MSEHSDTVRHCVERNNAGTIDPDDVTNLCNAALRLDEECERLHDGLEHCTKNSGEDSCAAILLENERLRAEQENTRNAVRLCIGRVNNIPWAKVKDAAVDGCVEFVRNH